ncbi:MAG: ASPIC/UnbV domain-containing protein, partial [Phycisphaerales bacterium]|nr:ASPIC/UnbV domain-containing protein [Phycisphaerales bacterium]
GFATGDPNHNYWYAIQEMVTQTKNQTTDARDWPVMGDRDLSGHERGRLFMQVGTGSHEATEPPFQGRLRHEGMERSSSADQSRERKRADNQSRDRKGAGDGEVRNEKLEERNTGTAVGNRQSAIGHPSRDTHAADTPTFIEVAERAGITDTYNGRGIALADFDHDGYIDMYVANQGAPSCYYINMTGRCGAVGAAKRSGFLWIKLAGRPDMPMTIGGRTFASTSDAVGTRVTVYAGDVRMIREVQGGMGFASQSEHAVHFGLPDPAVVSRITIAWPSGRMQEFVGKAVRALVNHHVRVVEGSNEVSSW